MQWCKIHWGVVSLLCLAIIVQAEPTINARPKKETAMKRIWEFFGWSAEKRPGMGYNNGINPCFPMTTTPAPIPGPLCPLSPVQGPNTGYPGDGQNPLQGGINVPGIPAQIPTQQPTLPQPGDLPQIPGQGAQPPQIPGQGAQPPQFPGQGVQPPQFPNPGQNPFPNPAGQPYNPDPNQLGPFNPNQPGPLNPNQGGVPFNPNQPGPYNPNQAGPFNPNQAGPYNPNQPGPFNPNQPGTFNPNQPGPYNPNPLPFNPNDLGPSNPNQPGPFNPNQGVPFNPNQPGPYNPNPVPFNPNELGPLNPNQQNPGPLPPIVNQVAPPLQPDVMPPPLGPESLPDVGDVDVPIVTGPNGGGVIGPAQGLLPGPNSYSPYPPTYIPGVHLHPPPTQLSPGEGSQVYPGVVVPGIPLRPYPIGPIPEGTTNMVNFEGYCAGVQAGPLIPPSFFLADNAMQQQRLRDQCRPMPMDVPPCSMIEIMKQLRLRTVYTLIQQAGLEQLFLQTSKYTFFAPVDAAFEKLPAWVMESLRDDIKLLRTFLLNHFVKDTVSLSSIGNEYRIMNARAGGHRLRVNIYHQDADYRTYTVDGAKILVGDIHTTNEGLLQVIDKVLIPNPPRSHAEYLTEMPDFKQFLGAVMESGMLSIFQDRDTPFTLFLPYNPAFKIFDYDSIAGNVAAIQNFVNYHIVNGTYYSAGLLHGQYLTTNYLKEIKLGVSTDGFTQYADTVNGRIRVLKADIPVVNGVVHVIENCLTYSREFLFDAEVNEFSMDFGQLKRSMTLNKKELEREFAAESTKQ